MDKQNKPSREDVYEAWLRVSQLERELAEAKATHQRLADQRYNDRPEQLREDVDALSRTRGETQ